MTKRSIALACLLISCAPQPSPAQPPPAQPAPRIEAPSPSLASLAEASTDRLSVIGATPDDPTGVLAIDGRPTDVRAGSPLHAHALGQRRLLLLTSPLVVWDPASAQIVQLPADVSAHEVPGAGYALLRAGYRHDRYGMCEVGDFDPQTSQFRLLHAGEEISILGLYRGGLLVSDASRLVIARPGRAAEVLRVSLEGRVPVGDALRDHRLLALRHGTAERPPGFAVYGHTELPTATVSVLDLDAERWRDLGPVTGCVYTIHMNCCNEASMLEVRWARDAPAVEGAAAACAHVVLERDESLHSTREEPR